MDAAVDFEREGPCLRRESLGLPEERERGETKELERKSPTGRVCSANFSGGWRGVLEMSREYLFKEENRGLDPRCSRTSFGNKFSYKAQHR